MSQNLRNELIEACMQAIQKRKTGVLAALELNKEGLQQETKSSMGDKFETTRAHLQTEDAKLKQQLSEINLLEQRMDVVKRTNYSNKIALGSVVLTNKLNYYLAIPAGKVVCNDKQFYAISPASPIGQVLLNQQKGDVFVFNQKSIEILDVL